MSRDPMTYEQKAKEIADKIWGAGAGVADPMFAQFEALITTALREAGNAKLEEAAVEIAKAVEPTRQQCRQMVEDAVKDKAAPELAELLTGLMGCMVDLIAAIPAGIRDMKSEA